MTQTLTLTVVPDGSVYFPSQPEPIALADLDAIAAGAEFRVRALSPVPGYAYVVIIGSDDNAVHVAYPTDGTSSIAAGEFVLPADAAWATAPVAGALRVVIANRPVSADEWPALQHGRDGNAHMPTGTEGARAPLPPNPSPTPGNPSSK